MSEDDLAEAARRLDEKRHMEIEKQKQEEAEARAEAERAQAQAWAQFGHNLMPAPADVKLSN